MIWRGTTMAEGKDTHDQDKAIDPQDAELAQDLEIKDAEDADAVRGGSGIDFKVDLDKH
jgi:hypothetical protein